MKKFSCLMTFSIFLLFFTWNPAAAQPSCDTHYADLKAAEARYKREGDHNAYLAYTAASNRLNACLSAGGTLTQSNSGSSPGTGGSSNTPGPDDEPDSGPDTQSLLPYEVRLVAEGVNCGTTEKTVVFEGQDTPRQIHLDGQILNADGIGIDGVSLKLYDSSGRLLKTGVSEGADGIFALVHKLNGDADALQQWVELTYPNPAATSVTISAEGYQPVTHEIDSQSSNRDKYLEQHGTLRESRTGAPISNAKLEFECGGSLRQAMTDADGTFSTRFPVDGCCLGYQNFNARYELERSLQLKLTATLKGHTPEEKTLTFLAENLPDVLTINGEVYGGHREFPYNVAGATVFAELPNGEVVSGVSDERGRFEMTFRPFLTRNAEERYQIIDDSRAIFKLKPTRLSVTMNYRPAKLGVHCREFPDESAIALAGNHIDVSAPWQVVLDGEPIKSGEIFYSSLGFYRSHQRINYVFNRAEEAWAQVSDGWTHQISFDSPGADSAANQNDEYPVYGKFSVTYEDGSAEHEAELDFMVLSMKPELSVLSAPNVMTDGQADFSNTFDLRSRSWGVNKKNTRFRVRFDGDIFVYDPGSNRMFRNSGEPIDSTHLQMTDCGMEESLKFSLVPKKQAVKPNAYLQRKDLNLARLEHNLEYLFAEAGVHEDLVKLMTPELAKKKSLGIFAPSDTTFLISYLQFADKVIEISQNEPLLQRIKQGSLGDDKYEISETIFNAADVLIGGIDVGMGYKGAGLNTHFGWQLFKANYTIWKHNWEHILKFEAYHEMIDAWIPLVYQPVAIYAWNEYGSARILKEVQVVATKPTLGQE